MWRRAWPTEWELPLHPLIQYVLNDTVDINEYPWNSFDFNYRCKVNNIQRGWMNRELIKGILSSWPYNWMNWSFPSLTDAWFLTCQIKEKLSVGEMRLKVTLHCNLTDFQKVLFIIIQLYTLWPVRLIECRAFMWQDLVYWTRVLIIIHLALCLLIF